MATGLLGDTSFLDTLQEASQVLNDRVSSSPFGNYTPSQASDYVVGPLGGIAQNKFMGDQFQTPNLFNTPYIPEAFNAASVLNAASTSPFNYNFGSYTPMPFNQGNVATTTTQPSLLGGNREGYAGRDRRGDMGPNVSTEFVGDRGFRIIDGKVTELDPNSLDYKLNSFFKGLLSSTPGAILAGALGQDMTTPDIARIRAESGDEAANFIAGALGQQGRGELQEAMKTETAQKAEAQRVSNRLAEAERIRQSRLGEGREKQAERDRKSREGRADRGFSRDSTGRKNY